MEIKERQINICIHICHVLPFLILFFLPVLPSFAEQLHHLDSQEPLVPSLVESIRFSKPLFFCGSKIKTDEQSVRERLEKEVLLALWDRPQVILWLKRASKFFPHMEEIIRQAGLPDDLKYVAVIESGLRPHVSSHKGAVGYWQFLRSTGRMYGLKINAHVDERRDLFKSTKSACRYLKELNRQFDDWFLAVAAYNMGARGLKNQIKIQESYDFYSLYLSEETQRYVFKIIAAKYIMENFSKFGFVFSREDYYPLFKFDRITINSPRELPITLVAKAAGVSFKTVKDYNPHLRGYKLDRGVSSILIPKGLLGHFEENFKEYYGKWLASKNGRSGKQDRLKVPLDAGIHDTRIHKVRSGENLALIAKKYNIRLSSLMKWNNLSSGSTIYPGDKLIVDQNR